MEGKGREIAIGTASNRRSAGINATEGMSGVFDDETAIRKFADFGSRACEPGHMHRDDRFCRRCGLKSARKRRYRHPKRIRIDIYEGRLGTCVEQAIRRSRESNRRRQTKI